MVKIIVIVIRKFIIISGILIFVNCEFVFILLRKLSEFNLID